MRIPSFFYELMPVIYLIAGVLSIRTLDSGIGQGSGWLLVAAAMTIVKLRLEYWRSK